MDHLRGFAIVAVVFHHAVDAAGWHDATVPAALVALDHILSPFRIPLLMFLSGMLLPKSLAKPAKTYFTGKLRRIVWPYLVWTTIVLLLLGELRTAGDAVAIALPGTHLWYLWALALYYVAAFVLRGAPPVVWLLSIVASIVVALFADPERIVYLWPFFAFGYLYSCAQDQASNGNAARSARLLDVLRLWWVRLVLGCIAGAAAVFSVMGWKVQYETVFMAAVLAGVLAVVRPFTLPENSRFTRVVQYVGTHSLIFYCVHWCVIGLTANAMRAAHIDNAWLVVATTFVVGLAGSWLFAYGADHWRVVDALFTFPSLRRSRSDN